MGPGTRARDWGQRLGSEIRGSVAVGVGVDYWEYLERNGILLLHVHFLLLPAEILYSSLVLLSPSPTLCCSIHLKVNWASIFHNRQASPRGIEQSMMENSFVLVVQTEKNYRHIRHVQ